MTDSYRILVTGATGVVGASLLAQLENAAKSGAKVDGKPIEAIGATRSEKKKAALAANGSKAVILDLDNPDSSSGALHGVDAVFLATSYTASMCEQSKFFADVCVDVGVKHFVHLGVLIPPREAKLYVPLIAWHELAELYIKTTFPDSYTFLHAGEFLDNCLSYNGRSRIRDGTISWYSVPDRPTLWIAGADIAAVAATALLNPAHHRGKTYRLGTQVATISEACKIFSDAVGKEIRHEMMDGTQLYEETEREDPKDVGRLGYIKFIAREANRRRKDYEHRVRSGTTLSSDESRLKPFPDVEQVLGRKTMGLREFAEANKDAFLERS
ncbi:NAD(P)-binding protein [Gonapodya prolifera JEL478]|uniref:NAD(P)-binding protein n=1 Tax=Gonapodya prolifera (strain JEL478) TaxID=1344416 RepID=A0A139AQJ1_GONPJ|nr:NAD(P)-binding protein [Gonapodya prolifera JEL478]|eukprot:KXS18773.1 NAD(P)-binding protein [Gonapodya prolifera JEL478]